MLQDPLARFRRAASGPRVFGHRGASARAPENTHAAFALALEVGADGIELDARRCASGEIVVMHDPTLARTAGDPRALRDVPFAELQRLDAGGGERVPLLDDVLDLVIGRDRLVQLEIKSDLEDRALLVERVAATLARRSLADRRAIAVSCFDPRTLWALRKAGLELPMLLLCENTRVGRALGRVFPPLFRAKGINPEHVLVTPAAVERWRAQGLLVTPWTVDGDARVRRLAGLGVDGLITNDPEATLKALRPPTNSSGSPR